MNLCLVDLLHTLKIWDKSITFEMIYEIIEKYDLSLVSKHYYEYYGWKV